MSQNQQIIDSNSVISHQKNCYLLYDSDLLKSPQASLLSGDFLSQTGSHQKIASGGRGQAWFAQYSGLGVVYRAYLRGGLVAKFNNRSYLGWSIENSRSFKEFRLLQWMHKLGLPVPKPVAASVCRIPVSLSPFYQAYILIERLENVKTFDQMLSEQVLTTGQWEAIGHCIRRFHNENIYHADLNAHNILLSNEKTVYLIDFDKSEQRPDDAGHRGAGQSGTGQSGKGWKHENLKRLKRSLLKQQTIHSEYNYSERDWAILLWAYDNNE